MYDSNFKLHNTSGHAVWSWSQAWETSTMLEYIAHNS